jgi:hypothetical protein
MKVFSPYRVRVIVDPGFGERLTSLPPGEPVWIVESSTNTPVAQRLWSERPNENALTGITTFVSHSGTPEDNFLAVLDAVDEHHGVFSADPPYTLLDVIGCPASEGIIQALAKLSFRVAENAAQSFHASRNVA